MTVIACSLKEMASDSLCHEEDSSHYFSNKMLRMSDGSILGGAGDHPEAVMDWIMRGRPVNDRPEVDEERDDFSILHLTHDGILLYVNALIPHRLKEKNYAIGSGGDVALYCMRHLNKSPAEAVREAIRINMFCGGEVDVIALDPRK